MDKPGSDEYPKARRENGEFKLPWKAHFAGFWGAMKWFASSANESNVP